MDTENSDVEKAKEVVVDAATEHALALEEARAVQTDALNRESEARIINAVITHFEQPAYSTRELDSRFTGIEDIQAQILQQTKKTNGSVADLKAWRSFITGGVSILTVIVVPVLGWLLLTVVGLDKSIGAVQAELKILIK